MEQTTYHCNRCMAILFRNEILFYDSRANILIIKEENALDIKKVTNNRIQCKECKTIIGTYENFYKTYMINKNLVTSITIIAEELEN